MPRNGITGSYGRPTFSFLRNLHLLSIVVVLIYILPVGKDSFFPTSICCLCFADRCSDRSEMKSQCHLICISPMDKVAEHLCIYWPFVIFLRIVCSFAHFFNGPLIVCGVSFLSSLYILVINPLSDVLLAKDFLSFYRLSLQSGDCFHCCADAF
jgi:hypothetical protein